MAVTSKQRGFNFDELALSKRIEQSKAFLQENGFLVLDPPKKNKAALCKNINELVKFFYARMYESNRNREAHPSTNATGDRKNMSVFLAARKSSGISRNRALEECESIIKVLFRDECILGLDSPVMSTSVLTQKWVVDKVLCIMNGESIDANRRFDERMDRNLELLEDDEKKIRDRLNDTYYKVVISGTEK